jgi:hypothetical protein
MQDDRDPFELVDELGEEDGPDAQSMSCGLRSDGQCSEAGSAFCGDECPFRPMAPVRL